MMRIVLAILASLVLTACEIAHSGGKTPDGRAIKVIVYDEGGVIENYDAHIKHLNNIGTKVKLMGVHISAGTMYLGANDVCVHPTARLGFHGSWLNKPGEKSKYDAMMAKYYTPALRDWYYENAANVQVAWVSMSGQELHDRFGYALCEV